MKKILTYVIFILSLVTNAQAVEILSGGPPVADGYTRVIAIPNANIAIGNTYASGSSANGNSASANLVIVNKPPLSANGVDIIFQALGTNTGPVPLFFEIHPSTDGINSMGHEIYRGVVKNNQSGSNFPAYLTCSTTADYLVIKVINDSAIVASGANKVITVDYKPIWNASAVVLPIDETYGGGCVLNGTGREIFRNTYDVYFYVNNAIAAGVNYVFSAWNPSTSGMRLVRTCFEVFPTIKDPSVDDSAASRQVAIYKLKNDTAMANITSTIQDNDLIVSGSPLAIIRNTSAGVANVNEIDAAYRAEGPWFFTAPKPVAPDATITKVSPPAYNITPWIEKETLAHKFMVYRPGSGFTVVLSGGSTTNYYLMVRVCLREER